MRTDSTLPMARERVRDDEKDRGVAVTSRAVPPSTRTGASQGTAARSFAERSDQLATPSVIMARPSSMASLSTISARMKGVSLMAKRTARINAHASRISSGDSTFFAET